MVHRGLQRLGVDLKRFEPLNDPHLRRSGLLRVESIDKVLDVGANRGQYAQKLRRYGYRGEIVSFEPLTEAYGTLARRAAKDGFWSVHRLALGERTGTRVMHVSDNSVSSSWLMSTPRLLDGVSGTATIGEEEVLLSTLDEAVPANVLDGQRVLLKLDVQGAEASVLRGGKATLGRVCLVELELPLVELYEGQASFSRTRGSAASSRV